MNHIKKGVISFILTLLTFFSVTPLLAGERTLPDSLLTVDKVYFYMFSNTEKAGQILKQMRQRKMAPVHELDIAEGDLLFNNGKYNAALPFYKRALKAKQVRNNDKEYMEQLHRMVSCYDCLHDEAKKAEYVKKLLKKAEACGNKPMQSIALFNMGKMVYYQEDKKKGYAMINKAIALMEAADYEYKYDNLRYNYNTLFIMQQRDKKYRDALKTLDKLEKVVTLNSDSEPEIDDIAQKELKTLYANRAVIYSMQGKRTEADAAYEKWKKTATFYTKDDYLIAPYLSDRHLYDEVIRIYSDREKFLRSQKDTVNYHIRTIKRSLAHAYAMKHDYKNSARYYMELADVTDSLKIREQNSAAQELAAAYESKKKDMEIQEQRSTIKIRNIAIAFIVILFLSALAFIIRILRYNKAIKRKNRAMVKTIDELMANKDELFKQQEENIQLREKLQKHTPDKGMQDEETKETEPVMAVNAADSEDIKQESASGAARLTEKDRSLYDRLTHEIVSKRLFLNPDFSKKELLKEIHVPANKFSALFKEFAGCSFTQYIQERRLDYAVRLMREKPQWSLDAIAQEVQMSKGTFYTLFQKKYGIKPSDYRGKWLSVPH